MNLAAVEPVHDIINRLTEDVDIRIQQLQGLVGNLLVTKNTLTRLQHQIKETSCHLDHQYNAIIDPSDTHADASVKTGSDEEDDNELGKLDQILSLARKIRANNDTKAKKLEVKATANSHANLDHQDIPKPHKAATHVQSKPKARALNSYMTKQRDTDQLPSNRRQTQRQSLKSHIVESRAKVEPQSRIYSNEGEVMHKIQQQDSLNDQLWCEDLMAQLALLGRSNRASSTKVIASIAAAGSSCNKDVYMAQMQLLSKLMQRPHHPQSLPFALMADSMPLTEGAIEADHRHNADVHGTVACVSARQGRYNIVLKLRDAFKSLITSYERQMKLRIASISPSQLSAQDRSELLQLWFRGRRLLQLYEHYAKRRRGVRCVCEACMRRSQQQHHSSSSSEGTGSISSSGNGGTGTLDLYYQLVANTPLSTPISSMSSMLSSQKAARFADHTAPDFVGGERAGRKDDGKGARKCPRPKFSVDGLQGQHTGDVTAIAHEWHTDSAARVKAFHARLQARVRYVAESAVGKHYLKECIHSLKACCEAQAQVNRSVAVGGAETGTGTGTASADLSFRNKDQLAHDWVSALQLYRSVYSMLVSEAHEINECMFLPKT